MGFACYMFSNALFLDILEGREELFGGPYAQYLPSEHLCEIELILLASRVPLGEPEKAKMRELLRGSLDWQFIYEFTRSQGLLALFYQSLNALNFKEIPEPYQAAFSTGYQQCAKWSVYSSIELVRILKLLELHGIPVIPFKGPVLSSVLYDDLRLRAFCDLDILIHKIDFDKTNSLLVASGFKPRGIAGDDELAITLSEAKDLAFVRDDGIVIEVHWDLMLPSKPFIHVSDTIWETAVSTSFLGSTVRQFAPEAMLVFMCVHHGISHLYHNLQMVCDISQFIVKHPNLDWNQVVVLAEDWDCLRTVLLGCLLAKTLRAVCLPPMISTLLKNDSWIHVITRDVIAWLLKNPGFRPSLLYTMIFYLKTKSGLKQRLQLIKCLIFTPRQVDLHFLELPPKLHFLYHIIRPLRLMRAYVKRQKYL